MSSPQGEYGALGEEEDEEAYFTDEDPEEALDDGPAPLSIHQDAEGAAGGFARRYTVGDSRRGSWWDWKEGEYYLEDSLNEDPKRKRFASTTEFVTNVSCNIISMGLAVGAIGIIVLLVLQLTTLQIQARPPQRYDYIIVGAGPAGSVLAKRLSDDITKRVLLIEAGLASQYELGGKDYLSAPLTPFDIPLLWPTVSHMKEYHWNIVDTTRPERPNALVAKALGGCGIHNAMLYVRALEEDFIGWNMTGWDWETMFQYYMKMENYTGPDSHLGWHGRDGPLTTSPPVWIDEVAPYFIQACQHMGMEITEDFNRPGGRMGAGFYNFAIKHGVRDSAARAMLGPILTGVDTRGNLNVITGARVRRVILAKQQLLGSAGYEDLVGAVGVEYEKDGQIQTARIFESGQVLSKEDKFAAGRGVIISAGALNTPKLLMASGVGDKEVLQSMNLPVWSDVPGVGRNLQDHPGLALMFKIAPNLLEQFPSAYTIAQELEKYKINVMKAYNLNFPAGVSIAGAADGEDNAQPFGIFASTGLTVGAFVRSPYTNASVPDIQLTVFPRVTEPHILVLNGTRPKDSTIPAMLITIALLNPEGRRSVRPNASDPINLPPYISHDSGHVPYTKLDLKKLSWAIRKVREIQGTWPLSEMTSYEISPDHLASLDQDNSEWALEHVYANSHWCGTAKMGKESDPMAVVDATLRVRGVHHLRVADASIIPTIPNGNVHSSVVMIAAHVADMILDKKPPLFSEADTYMRNRHAPGFERPPPTG